MKTNRLFFAFAILFALFSVGIQAQDRLPNMPGYDQYQKMGSQIRGTVTMGSVRVNWSDDGKSFDYSFGGKNYTYNLRKKKATLTGETEQQSGGMGRFAGMRGRSSQGRGMRPARGRQYTSALSPDEKIKAFYQDRNLWLSNADGSDARPVTTEGNDQNRLKFGTASWMYGEELGQTTAMWWSPDGTKLAFYKFDESDCKDYYLQYKQTEIQDSVDIEPYIKVGAKNAVVDILIYDLATRKTTKVDVRNGKSFDDYVVGHYVYGIEWTPDGKELLFHRTNRKQDIMELAAANPETGKTRVVVHEEWLPSFTQNTPYMRYLDDNYRFIWMSERTGFRNYYLYDLSGKLLVTLTNHPFEVANVVKIDEKAGKLWYMARDGENHMKVQLHVVGMDGKGDVRLTDPAFNHSCNVSPNGKYIIDIAQTHDIPPFTQLLDSKGKVISKLAESDLTKFNELGLKKVELFTFTAADGKTQLHGMLNFPSNFDPSKKYPVLVSVYGGPATNAARESFSTPNSMTEYGFLIASFDSRSAAQRGKRFLDGFYAKMGIVEMDDQAAGVKSLWSRPYVDKNNVGIFGTSYGGYSSAACILRHPEVFQAACAMSAVTDFRNYDAIYTERNGGIVQEHMKDYEAGSLMQYAGNLKGDLMIYYGTSDNNVHPSNALQLITALQRAGKNFEVQVGPDRGHTAVNRDRMMEFFIESLVLKNEVPRKE